MDDFFKSVKTTSDALELQQQLVVMLKRAGFNLTKWVSNVKEVIERIPESERAPSIKVVEENEFYARGTCSRCHLRQKIGLFCL